MNMKTLKYFIFALALSLFAVSCKPAEEAKKEKSFVKEAKLTAMRRAKQKEVQEYINR